ncbi:hypothetical protein D8674_042398 [Pyrus ussuriensis x Pyrus communis]|uniref:Uncharacterized protein n=1 Tax=Pyrus ussuriensis x Pyrus communis TaxID=2448454 RepID=A0A5N5GXA8_9ROSA|nr:hypothetical protein D8674_042398 [Pyrus ussuriensis x Pyrus communis]
MGTRTGGLGPSISSNRSIASAQHDVVQNRAHVHPQLHGGSDTPVASMLPGKLKLQPLRKDSELFQRLRLLREAPELFQRTGRKTRSWTLDVLSFVHHASACPHHKINEHVQREIKHPNIIRSKENS